MISTDTGVGNVIRISDKEFKVLTDYLRTNYGINLSKKRTLIEGRLNNYLIKKGFRDYSSYLEMLFGDQTGAEMSSVINYLTTNYSYFMREKEHFEFFMQTVLPQLKETVKDRDLRIWSAGCSTGEEPYTLAMIVREFFADEKQPWDKKILATDISLRALEFAQKGIYDEKSLEAVPKLYRLNNFTRLQDGYYQANESLRNEVIFRRFNLMEEVFPFKKKFHVIFCRNVMIYFDAPTKQRLIEKFYNATEKGGYLFVSQSETIDRSSSKYAYFMPSIYQKVE